MRAKRPSYLRAWLIFIPVLAALGPHASLNPASGGSAAYAFRFFVPVIFVVAWMRVGRVTSAAKATKAYFAWIWIYLAWGAITLIWAPSAGTGIREMVNVLIAWAGGACLVLLGRVNSSARALVTRGWILAFVLTGALGIYEKFSGQHLAAQEVLTGRRNAGDYVQSTFYNPNDFSGFLLFILPILLLSLVHSHAVRRAIVVVMLVLNGTLIVWTESRAGLLVMTGMIVYVLTELVRARPGKSAPVVVMALLFTLLGYLVFAVAHPETDPLSVVTERYGESQVKLGDEDVRRNLVVLGVESAKNSVLLGQGAGSFEIIVEQSGRTFETNGTLDAHNVLLEILTQYGLPVLLPLLWLFTVLVREGDARDSRQRVLGQPSLVRLGLVSLVAVGVVSSSTFESPWWWTALGTLVMLTESSRSSS